MKRIIPFFIAVAACGDAQTHTTDTVVSGLDVAIQDTTRPNRDTRSCVRDDEGRVVARTLAGQMDAPAWSAGAILYSSVSSRSAR